MTWYRFGREIGDDNDLACYMLDGMAGANDDPDGPVWARRFMEYMKSSPHHRTRRSEFQLRNIYLTEMMLNGS